MAAPVATPDPLRPPRPTDLRRAFGMAAGVHLLLLILLSLNLRWHSSEPPAVDAELWSASPQFAAAAAPPPPPQQPSPPARPQPAPPPPVGPRDADVALARQRAAQKAKQQAELKLRQQLEAQHQADLKQRQQHAAEQKKLAQQKAAKLKQEQAKTAAQKQAQLAQQKKLQQQQAREQKQARDAYLKNMLSQAGAGKGTTGANGNAAVTSGPSGGYGARLSTLIKQNVIFPQLDQIDGNPKVTLLVTLDPNSGEILGAKVTHSSGVASWDQAVQRALLRLGRLPSDHGHWWTPMEVTAGPRDAQ